MIKSFRDKRTAALFEGRTPKGIGSKIVLRARTKLLVINAAVTLETLRLPPGNHLEALKGDRAGQHSIRVNQQFRICFTWRGTDAFGVEFCDYH